MTSVFSPSMSFHIEVSSPLWLHGPWQETIRGPTLLMVIPAWERVEVGVGGYRNGKARKKLAAA